MCDMDLDQPRTGGGQTTTADTGGQKNCISK